MCYVGCRLPPKPCDLGDIIDPSALSVTLAHLEVVSQTLFTALSKGRTLSPEPLTLGAHRGRALAPPRHVDTADLLRQGDAAGPTLVDSRRVR